LDGEVTPLSFIPSVTRIWLYKGIREPRVINWMMPALESLDKACYVPIPFTSLSFNVRRDGRKHGACYIPLYPWLGGSVSRNPLYLMAFYTVQKVTLQALEASFENLPTLHPIRNIVQWIIGISVMKWNRSFLYYPYH